jgi:hypothetical protein
MARVTLHSKSFRKGLLGGFTAYYQYFQDQKYPRAKTIDPSVGAAWRAVGDALKHAELTERGKIGKSSRKNSEKHIAA